MRTATRHTNCGGIYTAPREALVCYQVGRCLLDQFAQVVPKDNHPMGAYLPVVRLSWIWYDDSLGCLPAFGVVAYLDAQPGGFGDPIPKEA